MDLISAIAVVVLIWLALVALLMLSGRDRLARELALFVPNVARLFRGLLGDSRVPAWCKLLLLIAIVWIASPIDLIPEFIPVAGPLDDAIVAALVLRQVVRAAGPEVVAAHWHGEPATLRALFRLAGLPVPS